MSIKETLSRELKLLLSGEKSVTDFIQKFCIIYDEIDEFDESIQVEIEKLNEAVAYFEPNEDVRTQTEGFIGETEFKNVAQTLLESL